MTKNRKRPTSSGMFLIELILSILIFAIVSAICVQFFMKSYRQSQEAKQLSFAGTKAAAVGEIISASDSEKEAKKLINRAFDRVNTDGDVIRLYFDKEFKNCSENQAVYTVIVVINDAESDLSGRDISANILVNIASTNEEIYSLFVKHHAAGGR